MLNCPFDPGVTDDVDTRRPGGCCPTQSTVVWRWLIRFPRSTFDDTR